jgi:hypothetical protein
MAEPDYEKIGADFERHPVLKLKDGEEIKVKFEDNGNVVSAEQLKSKGAKFPRDSYVYVVSVGAEKKEFWVSSQSFSLLKQIKKLWAVNSSLVGVRAKVKRISSKTTETNYEITGI